MKKITLDRNCYFSEFLNTILHTFNNLEAFEIEVEVVDLMNIDEFQESYPSVKSIVVNFLYSEFHYFGANVEEPFEIFKSFPELEELHFHNIDNAGSQAMLVGCLSYPLTHLTKLRHLTLISQLPGTYCPPSHFSLDLTQRLFEMQGTEEFKHLQQLETLRVDQLLLDRFLDMTIQMLRMSGVHVSVVYQTGVEKDDGIQSHELGPLFLDESFDEENASLHEFSTKIFQKVT
ncbi:uncharacterized protein LOC125033902 [Penaeus chinensis]|uniref:uncharacterized protein LOC125033902 n=1 Tax=Penaeus chinensis TaxID=139456 RepID=UPI001FB7CD55|nr:uncharacterized protein LOC125033902 [Penaeus chinensis]